MYADATAADYLEHMVHGFFNELVGLQELEGVSNDEMEIVYALGYNCFVYGIYEQAKEIFTDLVASAPWTAHYWRALGAVNQQLENYTEAIDGYSMAIANDETDVVSYVYRAESHILSGDVGRGLEDLDTAAVIGASYPQYSAWLHRARLLIGVHRP